MTKNFDIIREYMLMEGIPLLAVDAKDLFFSIMLVRRGKDHPNLPAANYNFKSYYIDSIEKYEKSLDEIVKCCDMFGLRAYVSVNVKSKETFSKYCNFKFSQDILNNEYKKPWRVIDHVFGSIAAKNEDRWIVDIDDVHPADFKVERYCTFINKCRSKFLLNTIRLIPTKSGVHIITHRFDPKDFALMCQQNALEVPEIKKNHVTLLYENV